MHGSPYIYDHEGLKLKQKLETKNFEHAFDHSKYINLCYIKKCKVTLS